MDEKLTKEVLAELILIVGTLDADSVPKNSLKRFKKLYKWAKQNCCEKHSPKARARHGDLRGEE